MPKRQLRQALLSSRRPGQDLFRYPRPRPRRTRRLDRLTAIRSRLPKPRLPFTDTCTPVNAITEHLAPLPVGPPTNAEERFTPLLSTSNHANVLGRRTAVKAVAAVTDGHKPMLRIVYADENREAKEIIIRPSDLSRSVELVDMGLDRVPDTAEVGVPENWLT